MRRYRLYRDSCLNVQGNFLKDLAVLGRDLSRVLIIDNSPIAFAYHVCPVVDFSGRCGAVFANTATLICHNPMFPLLSRLYPLSWTMGFPS